MDSRVAAVLQEIENRLHGLREELSCSQQTGAVNAATSLAAFQLASQQLLTIVGEASGPAPAQARAVAEAPPLPSSSYSLGGPEKLVKVPVRKRSGLARQEVVGQGWRNVGLPATPFGARPAPTPAPAARGDGHPPRDLPATTPIAAEVLASLGLALTGAAPGGGPMDAADLLQPAGVAHGLSAALDAVLGLVPAAQLEAAGAAAAAAAAAAAPAAPRPRSAPQAAAGREARPCNCKRSQCLKMYCECFAAGGFCAPGLCSCTNCFNTETDVEAVQEAREVVLAKNPAAFQAKVSAKAGHTKGCRCKRSKCLKKYCECFSGGARCNPDVCACEGCRNMPGDPFVAGLEGAPLPLMSGGVLADAGFSPLPAFAALQPDPMPAAVAADSGLALAFAAQEKAAQPLSASLGPPHLSGQLPDAPAASAFMAPPLELFTTAESGCLDLATAALFQDLFPLPHSTGPAAAVAMVLNPVAPAAAVAAPAMAAAATVAGRQQHEPAALEVEESFADAAPLAALAALASKGAVPAAEGSWPASNPLETAAAVNDADGSQLHGMHAAKTPGAKQALSALTSHLSEAADPEMHDTATSPAPLMALVHLAAWRQGGPAAVGTAATLTGGGGAGPPRLKHVSGRPPAVPRRLHTAASGGSQLSLGMGDEENAGAAANLPGSQRSKRPRRAASGGVSSAVAAEVARWGLDAASPPLKRSTSLQSAQAAERDAGAGRGKVSDRVALLRRALAGEQKRSAAASPPAQDLEEMEDLNTTQEDSDAVSALFALSSSVC